MVAWDNPESKRKKNSCLYIKWFFVSYWDFLRNTQHKNTFLYLSKEKLTNILGDVISFLIIKISKPF